jgi:enoyl-CoA hydratase/carnithine racemase
MTKIAPVEPPHPLLAVEDHDDIRVITFDNPARRNPLSRVLIADLHAKLIDTAGNPDIRVVILTHAGPAFSAGHDLREIQAARQAPDGGRDFFVDLMAACAAMMLQIRAMPQPVIAVIEGIATAAGCQLVATCDLAVAGTAARFATPGVNIGLFCSTPMVALSRNVSHKHAMEMLLTGDMIDAETAFRFGLVNRIAPAGEGKAAAEALARQIASKPAATVKIGKQAFYRQHEMTLEQAYAFASGVMVENMLMREADEGIGAFVAPKR